MNRRSSRNRSPDAGRPSSSSVRFQNVPGGGLAGEQAPHEHLHEKLRGKTLPSAWKQPRGMHQRSTVSSSTRQEVQSNVSSGKHFDLQAFFFPVISVTPRFQLVIPCILCM